MNSTRSNRSMRQLLLTLTAFALAARLVVPAGFMPAPVESGWPLSLCGDGIPAVVMAGLTGQAHHHHHHHSTQDANSDSGRMPESCDLGGGLAADLTVSAGFELDDNIIRSSLRNDARRTSTQQRLIRRYLTRAPPHLS